MILYVLGRVSDVFVWHADDDGDKSESDASDYCSDLSASLPGCIITLILQLRN